MAVNYSAKFSIGGIPEFEGAAKNAQQSLDQILVKWQEVAKEAEKARNAANRSGDSVAANQFDQQRVEAIKKSNAAIAQAYKTLKITPSSVEQEGINKQIAAYETLRKSGVASYQDIEKARQKLQQAQSQTAINESKLFQTGSAVLAGAGGYAIANSFVEINRRIFETSAKFERLNNAIQFSSGSSIAAAKNIRFLNSEIGRLNLDKGLAYQQYGQLLGGTQGTLLEGDAGNKIFSAVSQAGSVQGLSTEQQQRALTAITQMIGKGRVTAEELRGQLGEALPSAFSTFAQALGVTTGQLNAMLEKGELGADELQKFAAQLKSNTDSGVAGAADLATSKLIKFNNSLTDLQLKAGEGILPLQKLGLDVAANSVDFLNKNLNILKTLLVGGAIASVGFLVQIGKFLLTLPIVQSALASIGASLAANAGAIALFAGKIVLATIAYEIWSNTIKSSSDESAKSIQSMVNASSDNLKRFRGEIKSTQEAFGDKPLFEQVTELIQKPLGLSTYEDIQNQQKAIAYSNAISNFNEFASKPLFDEKATQDQIDRITSKINQLKAIEISQGDRQGREENTKQIQKLIEERDKLNQKFADEQAIIQGQIDTFKKIKEDLLKNSITAQGKALKDQFLPLVQSSLDALEKTQGGLGKLMNRVSNSLSEVTKNVRDLNESYAKFNDQLERQNTLFAIQQASANTGSSLTLPPEVNFGEVAVSGAKTIDDYAMTSPFGWRNHPVTGERKFHQGVDFGVPEGTPLSFAGKTKVVDAGFESGYGNFVEIQTENGLKVFFAHLSEVMVKKGDQLFGNIIAKTGSTGRGTGAHLHTEIRTQGGVLVNPESRQDILKQIRFGGTVTNKGGKVQAIARVASNLGVTTEELAAIIAQESGFDPTISGGDGNNYKGLFQWGPSERTNELPSIFQKIGVNRNAEITQVPFEKQLEAFELWARGRGFKTGMGQQRLYATILGGNPYATGADSNGTVAGNNPSITKGGSNYQAGLDFLRKNGAANLGASRNFSSIPDVFTPTGDPLKDFLNAPKGAEFLQSQKTIFELSQGQQRVLEAQKLYAGASSALNAPNVLENARAANAIGADGQINPSIVTRLLGDKGTDAAVKQSLEIVQKFIDARANLEKVTADFSQKNLAYAQQIKGLNYQADDAKRQAANDDANQKFQANINLIAASFDLQIAQTLDENKKKLLESQKQLTLQPLNQGLKLQQENQKLLELQTARNRQLKDGDPFGINTKALDQQIATQKQAIANLEKENDLANKKLNIEDQNLKKEISITLELERQNQRSQLRIELLKAQNDELIRQVNRDYLTNNKTQADVGIQTKLASELGRINAEREKLNQDIKNAQNAYNELVRKNADQGLIEIAKDRLDMLVNAVPVLDRQVGDAYVQALREQSKVDFDKAVQKLSNQTELANSFGELSSLRAAKFDRNNDLFGGNALRRSAETRKLNAELQAQIAPLDRLLNNPTELKESGKTAEQVQELKNQLIEINQLKLENVQREFADLGTSIAESADKAANTFFDNISEWILDINNLGDSLRQFALTIIKTLSQIAGQGILGGIKSLFGLGGTQSGGFASLFGLGGNAVNAIAGGGGGGGFAESLGAGLFGGIGFDEGGFTGYGGKNEPAGIVHKGEMVFSQKDVGTIGLNVLNSIRSTGRLPIQNIRSGNNEGRSQPSTSVNVVNNFTGGLQDSFRRSSAQIANQQAEATRRAARYGR